MYIFLLNNRNVFPGSLNAIEQVGGVIMENAVLYIIWSLV